MDDALRRRDEALEQYRTDEFVVSPYASDPLETLAWCGELAEELGDARLEKLRDSIVGHFAAAQFTIEGLERRIALLEARL